MDQNETNLSSWLKHLPEAYAYHQVITNDDGEPVDCVFLQANPAFEAITGLKVEAIIGRRVTEVMPGIESGDFDWIGTFGQVALTGESCQVEQYAQPLGRWYSVTAYSDEPGYFAILFHDITEQQGEKETLETMMNFSQRFLDTENVPDLQEVTEYMCTLTGAAYAFFNLFDDNGLDFTTLAIVGASDNLMKAAHIMGFNPVGKKWPHDPDREEKTRHHTITHFENLDRLTGSALPSKLVFLLEKTFDIGQVAIVKIMKHDRVLGDFTLLMPHGETLAHQELAVLYASQVGLMLDREKYHNQLEQKNQQLQETKERLAGVLDYSHDVILRIDQQDTITFANHAYCELVGRERSQVVGRPLWEFVNPEKQRSVKAHLETMKKAGEVEVHTDWLQDAKGENRWFEWTDYPVRDKTGTIVEYQSVGHDMTHRFVLEQHLLESEARYRSVIAASGTGAWEFHHQKKYLWCSPQYFQMLGYDPAGFVMDEKPNLEEVWINLIHPKDREKAAGAFTHYLQANPGEMYDNTFRMRCADGSWAWIWSRGQTLKNSDGTLSNLTVGTHINITEQKKMEETIALSERTHREIFNSAVDALFTHDIETGEILDVNDTMLKMFGYKREELPELSLPRLSGFEDPFIEEKAKNLIRQCAAGEDVTFEWVCRRQNGETFFTENHLHRVTIAGQPRIMATVRDITDRKRAETKIVESEKILSRTQEIAHVGSWQLDLTENRLTWSDEVYRIFGCQPQAFASTYEAFLDFVHPDDREEVDKAYSRSLKERSSGYKIEHRIVRRNSDEVRYVQERCVHERNDAGTIIKSTGMVQDITEYVEQEKELQAFADQLEKKNIELDIALYQSQAADEAKTKYLATMNHEIRTPVNGLLGFLRLLDETHLDEEQTKYMSYMKRSATHLLSMINNVLDMGKIEAGEMQLDNQPFHLAEEIDTALAALQPMAREKDLQLQVIQDPRLPKWLEGDPRRLRQIILNLVSNALKFTEAGSVHLSIESLGITKGSHSLHLEVRDTGPGMDQATQGQIFQPFYQAQNNHDHHSGGTGLGLAITRELVELMGGWIQVHSAPGKGSTFSVRLNLKEIEEAPQNHQKSSPSQKTNPVPGIRRLLLVEDQPVNQVLMKHRFTERGLAFDLAQNGKEAVEMAIRHPYDLILMDIQMPLMDGLEATRQIRNNTEIPQPRIVAMTACATLKDQEAFLAAGIDDFLTKPIDIENLDRLLNDQT